MKDNSIALQLKNDIDNIESSKNKYFFYGFIIGSLPFILIICFINNYSNDNLSILTNILLVASLITATLNAFILRFTTYSRLKEFFNLKYDLDYNKIKEELN